MGARTDLALGRGKLRILPRYQESSEPFIIQYAQSETLLVRRTKECVIAVSRVSPNQRLLRPFLELDWTRHMILLTDQKHYQHNTDLSDGSRNG